MKLNVKKLLVVIMFVLGVCIQAQTPENSINLAKGSVSVYNFGNIKMHAYFTKDMMNDLCIVIEKNGKSIIIESPAFWDNFDEFRSYLSENNIEVKGIFPAYHPLGATFIETEELKNSQVFLTENVIEYWENGYGSVMKTGIPKIFGDKIDSKLYDPTILLEEGEINITGIDFVITNTYDGFDIEIPEIKTVYVHILGHDTHSEILGDEHLKSSIVNLKKYINEGYETFLSSHYKPETRDDAITKVTYLEEMENIVSKSKTGGEFIASMKATFPDYKDGYLLATTEQFFKDFKRPQRPEPKSEKQNISRFPIPEVEDLPKDIQAIVKGTKANRGFVPNVLSALTYRPEFLRGFLGFNKGLVREGTGLTSVEREMMIVVFSAYNSCDYCMASHGFGLATETGNPELVKQLKIDYTKADITPRQKAVIEFGLKITKEAATINEDDFEILRLHGLSDDDIFDAAAYAAFFNMSNRMMSVMKVMPDDEYKLKK